MTRKFCPKCGSEDVKIEITPTAVVGMPQRWVCNECNYSNFVFPEKEELEEEE